MADDAPAHRSLSYALRVPPEREGFAGEVADLYDVFVDWPGRLGREMPGLAESLRAAGAGRVLDVGCGTGRHVKALLDEGFDAFGADASDAMLAKARDHVGDGERFFSWRLGEPPPESVRDAAPFDGIIALGNVWTLLSDASDVEAAGAALRELVAPSGLVLLGLKAVAVRRETGDPYLPLLRRTHEGEAIFFVRFVDFALEADELCDFHMTVLRGDAASEAPEAHLHRTSRWRVWNPESLRESLQRAGFADVRVSARLDDPDAPPTGEDVFVHARASRS